MTAPLVFITGASSGIGQALALRFHQGGYRLALVARRTSEMESWAGAQGISADSYEIYSADVSVPESIVAAGQDCIGRQGLPDVVVANAGISVGMDTAVRADIDVMARTFATNNIGMAATFQPFVSGMVQRRCGTLVGIGSVAGIRGLPGAGAYGASKAAVIAYGSFINVLIQFLIVAFAVFILIKVVNKVIARTPAAPPAPTPTEVLLTEIRDTLKSK